MTESFDEKKGFSQPPQERTGVVITSPLQVRWLRSSGDVNGGNATLAAS